MCFSPRDSKNQKDFFKIYYNKKIKENLNKAQIYLISHKELISRNYEKIKNNKKNTYRDSDKDNNKIGTLLQNSPKILNNSCLNSSQNKNISLSINNYKNKNNNLISSYSFHRGAFFPLNNTSNKENNNNKCFNSNSKTKKLKNNSNNLNKIQQNNNSSLNIKNISVLLGNNKNKSCINFNKKNSKEKNISGNTRNNINKNNNNFKKINKFPISPYNANINSLLSNTTRQKSIFFSSSSSIKSINSSYTNFISNLNNNISERIKNKKTFKKCISKDKENTKKNVIKNNEKMNENISFKKKLKKTFFDYISKDINKSKEKRNESINLFKKLCDQIGKEGFSDLNPFFKIKTKKSSRHSNKDIIKYNYNKKNKDDIIRNNNIATSGSINNSIHDDIYAEEIHFKAVKYLQEIKNNEDFYG